MTYATNSDKSSIEERYVAATNSRDLSFKSQARTDADILLAAGYAAACNGRSSLALAFYRLKATGDLAEFRALSNIAGAWLHGRSMRRGRKKMRMIEACDLASRVLFWWIGPSCTPCEGRGHPLMPNSPVINPGHDCPVCRGTGQYPIHRIVPPGTADEARWLVDEIDQHCGIIFSDMGRLLAARLEL